MILVLLGGGGVGGGWLGQGKSCPGPVHGGGWVGRGYPDLRSGPRGGDGGGDLDQVTPRLPPPARSSF